MRESSKEVRSDIDGDSAPLLRNLKGQSESGQASTMH